MIIAGATVLAVSIGCGVKSKPLAPLKEPWISTGSIEKDREKRSKIKKPPTYQENRVEFAPETAEPDSKKEL